MFEKLQAIEQHFQELEEKIADPAVISRQEEWRKLTKEHAQLSEIVSAYREYKQAEADLEAAKEMLGENSDDEDMESFLKEEIRQNTAKKEQLTEKLRFLLLPRDPNDEKNVIVEIRAGTGGEEAGLFAATCFACIPTMRKGRAGRRK